MLIAILIGLFIYYVYKKTFRGVVYSHSYNITFVLMTMMTTLIIMTISSNVVLSLGMVGALSIVRFRTAIKDPIDIVFMFWSITAGIATGAGMYPIAIVGSLVMGATVYLLSKKTTKDSAYLLVIHYTEEANDGVKYHINKLHGVLKSKTVRKERIEVTVEIKLKNDNTVFVNEISALAGVNDVVLVSYNGDYAP
ncbi:DUF4956 domain-containing protein [Paenibacillus rigui]|uniref:DUF4956 domain-containing protein n=2 Tax=Paenibacillus rigui TaxID=554312 RepID=A0A229UTI5_9BACL|nr:DUF4956 domain-containing protein [Paenibacillus rigui]